MVKCSCGKTIEKIPDWMQRVTVDFVCNNCPNRTTKNIAFVDLTPVLSPQVETDELGDEDLEDIDE
jgi:hypothetical protein